MKTKKRNKTVQISVSLPLDTAAELARESAKKRITKSAIICIALEQYFGVYEAKTAAMIREATAKIDGARP